MASTSRSHGITAADRVCWTLVPPGTGTAQPDPDEGGGRVPAASPVSPVPEDERHGVRRADRGSLPSAGWCPCARWCPYARWCPCVRCDPRPARAHRLAVTTCRSYPDRCAPRAGRVACPDGPRPGRQGVTPAPAGTADSSCPDQPSPPAGAPATVTTGPARHHSASPGTAPARTTPRGPPARRPAPSRHPRRPRPGRPASCPAPTRTPPERPAITSRPARHRPRRNLTKDYQDHAVFPAHPDLEHSHDRLCTRTASGGHSASARLPVRGLNLCGVPGRGRRTPARLPRRRAQRAEPGPPPACASPRASARP